MNSKYPYSKAERAAAEESVYAWLSDAREAYGLERSESIFTYDNEDCEPLNEGDLVTCVDEPNSRYVVLRQKGGLVGLSKENDANAFKVLPRQTLKRIKYGAELSAAQKALAWRLDSQKTLDAPQRYYQD